MAIAALPARDAALVRLRAALLPAASLIVPLLSARATALRSVAVSPAWTMYSKTRLPEPEPLL